MHLAKYHLKILLACLYLAGRICLTSTYTFGQEDRRFIILVNLSQFVYSPAKFVIQSEKQAPAILRKTNSDKPFSFSEKGRYFLNKEQLIASFSYSGAYIDPPKLV
jgi:hypothetical protein